MNFDDRAILKFEIEIGFYEQYLETMEVFLQSEYDDHATNIERLKADLDNRKISPDQFEAWTDKDRFYLESTDWHRNLLRRSFFVAMYSYLEHCLIEYCRTNAKNFGQNFSWARVSRVKADNDLDKMRLFLIDEFGIPFPNDSPEWAEIQNYRLLRNCIVHEHGFIEDSKEADNLTAYVTRKRGLLLLVSGEVCLQENFCDEVYRTIKDFLSLMLFGVRLAD